jgi:hypothetical protein
MLTLRPLDKNEPTTRLTASYAEERWASPRPVVEPQVTVVPRDSPDNGPYRQMLTRVLEVLDGRRPIGQLRSLLTGPIFEATLTRLRMTPPSGVRYQLQSVHSCRPGPDVVELCGRVEVTRGGSHERRAVALTARLELHFGAWQCVFLRLLM